MNIEKDAACHRMLMLALAHHIESIERQSTLFEMHSTCEASSIHKNNERKSPVMVNRSVPVCVSRLVFTDDFLE